MSESPVGTRKVARKAISILGPSHVRNDEVDDQHRDALRGKCQTVEEATWISCKRLNARYHQKLAQHYLKREARQEGEMGYKSFKTTMPS